VPRTWRAATKRGAAPKRNSASMTELPLGDLPRYHAQRKPSSAQALIHPEGALTWSELEFAANRRANLYRSLGVKAGDFVTVALPNGNALCESVFAIWKLGATPNPISASLPAVEARAILELVRPSLVIAESFEGTVGGPLVSGAADLQGYPPDPPPKAPPAEYWKAMTSGGSTGRPKVIVADRPAFHDPTAAFMGQRPDGIILNACPLYHNAGFMTLSRALFTGNLAVGMRRFDAEEALRLIERHRVEWVVFVPTMMHRIFRLPAATRLEFDISSLQAVWHGMSFMPASLKHAWLEWLGPEKLWEIYGGTEGQGWTAVSGIEWLQRPGTVGRCQPGCSIRILREDGSPAPIGEIGEVVFLPDGGAGSTYHYIGAEAKRFDSGWESIGDLGRLDADGYLYLADRRTDLIIRGGANIYPAEVEAVLDGHPDVASSLVVGLPDPDLGNVVHAIVEPRADRAFTAEELDEYLLERLAKYKLPASYEVSPIPLRDDAGKARRAAVRAERERWLREGQDFRLQRARVAR